MKKLNNVENIFGKVSTEDLSSFIARSFQAVNPATDYYKNWHIDLIAEYLQAVTNGEIKRLIINMPPRMLKSVCVSVAWPAWLLGLDPSRRIICASYAQHLSLKHSLDCRLVMESPWYRELFPDTELSGDQNEKSKFMTMERGYRIATSVGGSITGEGGNFLIVDDPQHPAQVESIIQRETAIDWFDRSFMSRLDDKKRGVIIVVMQRLHEGDLSGHILANSAKYWENLSLPAIAERKSFYQCGDIEIIRETGELLHPQREGELELEQIKSQLGSYGFAAQYQQQPIPREGGLIKPVWLQHYDISPDNPEQIIQSWDTAIKVGKYNDYSVCTTWAVGDDGFYLLDVVRRRMEYPELKRAIISSAQEWDSGVILIEDKASGQSLLQDLRRETRLPCIAIMPVKDKVTRAASVSALFEAGKVFLPKMAKWLLDYEAEILAFPGGAHDDQMDSTTQFLNWVKARGGDKPVVRGL